jgi:MSHA biogenesis protein MshO
MRNPLSVKGFTLIELVIVVVILAIMATAVTNYIIFGTQIYVDGQLRQQTLSSSRYAIQRLTREIQEAIPNSVRVDDNGTNYCIEFAPIKASGAYREDAEAVAAPPFKPGPEGNQIDVISWNGFSSTQSGDRIYVYPRKNSDVYDETNSKNDQFSIIDSVTLGDANPQYLITLDGNDRFGKKSDINRFFTADHTVQFCLIPNSDSYDLYRFEQTTFSSNMQFLSKNSGVLMAERVVNDMAVDTPFTFQDGATVRNSIVNVYLIFSTELGEDMFFNQEIHVANVP